MDIIIFSRDSLSDTGSKGDFANKGRLITASLCVCRGNHHGILEH